MFTKLTKDQIKKKKEFIENYKSKNNPATLSILDANANVAHKNIATLEAEINKDINIQINRAIVSDKITEMFGEELWSEYIRQIEDHEIYAHDETSLKPYCVSINMYPLLTKGMTTLWGESKAPKNIFSFAGSFVNLVFAVASQFAWAVATVEFLMYFDHFARKQWGEGYTSNITPELHKELTQLFQHVVYSINQPAAARGYQCVKGATTQLSTPEWYKYLYELKVWDECYVWKDWKIEIEKIKRLNVHDFNWELIQFKWRNYQQTVTENHRVLFKKPNENSYDIREAKDLVWHSKLSLPIGSEWVDREDFPINDDLLKISTTVLTDWTIDNGRITIYKSPNRWGITEIPEMLDRLWIGYKIEDNGTSIYWEVKSIKIGKVDASLILRTILNTKKSIPYFFSLLSKRQIELVIDVWSKTDWTNRNWHIQLQCDNNTIRDKLQELVFLAWYGSRFYDRKMTKFNSNEEYIVKYIKLFKRKNNSISKYNRVKYKWKVWCPTTDAWIVIFREENKMPYISGNSVFWNISIFDKNYFSSLFGDFVFPDWDRPKWSSLNGLQKIFMEWFNEERGKAVLTFPVITAAMLTENGKVKDEDFANFLAKEMSEGNSFFIYQSNSVDSLASCCRLRNELTDNTFSYSLWAWWVSTWSINVITINFNRLIQKWIDLKTQIGKLHKYQLAYLEVIKDYERAWLLPVYNAGYISLAKQFLTIWINWMVEAAESLWLNPSNNDEYKAWVALQLKVIYDANRAAKASSGVSFNTEFVPAENLGVKNSKWDKKDWLKVTRDCYNSYFYVVEDDETSMMDKFALHWKEMIEYLDWWSALHLNLDELLTKENALKLLNLWAANGCNYFTFNVRSTICNGCGFINKETRQFCTKCGSMDIDYGTRVIGYLKRVSAFSEARQTEEHIRFYN